MPLTECQVPNRHSGQICCFVFIFLDLSPLSISTSISFWGVHSTPNYGSAIRCPALPWSGGKHGTKLGHGHTFSGVLIYSRMTKRLKMVGVAFHLSRNSSAWFRIFCLGLNLGSCPFPSLILQPYYHFCLFWGHVIILNISFGIQIKLSGNSVCHMQPKKSDAW